MDQVTFIYKQKIFGQETKNNFRVLEKLQEKLTKKVLDIEFK
jgi:hypothetical protein